MVVRSAGAVNAVTAFRCSPHHTVAMCRCEVHLWCFPCHWWVQGPNPLSCKKKKTSKAPAAAAPLPYQGTGDPQTIKSRPRRRRR